MGRKRGEVLGQGSVYYFVRVWGFGESGKVLGRRARSLLKDLGVGLVSS